MTNWIGRVKIRYLLTENNDLDGVRFDIAAIADVLDKSFYFRGFDTKSFRSIPDGDEIFTPLDYANRLLDRMYDFADANRIWIE